MSQGRRRLWGRIKWIAIVLLVAAAAFNLISRPATPMIGPDAVGYFGPALAEYRTGKFESIATRSIVYPLFVRTVYRAFGSAEAVVQAQRALFVLALLLIALLYLEADRAFFRPSKVTRRVLEIAAILTVAYVGFNAEITGFIDYLHPEGLTVFMTIAVLLPTIAMVRMLREGRAPVGLCILLGAALPVLALFQTRWALLPLALLIYLLLHIATLRRHGSLARWPIAAVLMISFVCSAVVLGYANKRYIANDTMNISMVSRSLFAVNMNAIARVIEQRIETGEFADVETAEGLLEFYRRAKTPEADRYSTGGSTTLGYNVDFMNSMDAYMFLERRLGGDHQRMNSFYRDWLLAAVGIYPLEMAGKIAHEMWSMTFAIPKFFSSLGPCKPRLTASEKFLHSWRPLFGTAELERVAAIYEMNRERACASPVATDNWFVPLARHLNLAYVLVWLAFGGFALAYALTRRRQLPQPVWLFAIWSGAIIASISASFFVQPVRYSEDLQVVSLLFVSFFLISVVDIAVRRYNARPSNPLFQSSGWDWS